MKNPTAVRAMATPWAVVRGIGWPGWQGPMAAAAVSGMLFCRADELMAALAYELRGIRPVHPGGHGVDVQNCAGLDVNNTDAAFHKVPDGFKTL